MPTVGAFFDSTMMLFPHDKAQLIRWNGSHAPLGYSSAASTIINGRQQAAALRDDIGRHLQSRASSSSTTASSYYLKKLLAGRPQKETVLRSPSFTPSVSASQVHSRTAEASTAELDLFKDRYPREYARAGRHGDLPETSLERAVVRGFVVRGLSHYCKGHPGQDAAITLRTDDCIILGTSDGVSEALFSHFGAQQLLSLLAAETSDLVKQHQGRGSLLTKEFLTDLFIKGYEATARIARMAGLHPYDAWHFVLPATCKLAIITKKEALILGLGDGYYSIGTLVRPVERKRHRAVAQGSSTPALLGRAWWADSLSARRRAKLSSLVREMIAESRGLHLYGYYAAEDTLSRGLTLSSDGLSFCESAATRDIHRMFDTEACFPALRALSTQPLPHLISHALLHHFTTAKHFSHPNYHEPRLAILHDLFHFCTLHTIRHEVTDLLKEKFPPELLDAELSPAHLYPAQLSPELEQMVDSLQLELGRWHASALGVEDPRSLLPLWDDLSMISASIPGSNH